MACPRCGATTYELIAPGFVECTAVYMSDEQDNYGNLRPRPMACQNRYHLSGAGAAVDSGERCACGLSAIGKCPECGTPYCGDDSFRRSGLRLCKRCASNYDHMERRQSTAKQAAENTRLEGIRQALHDRENEAKAALPGLARELNGRGFPGSKSFPRRSSWIGRVLSPRVKLVYVTTSAMYSYIGLSADGGVWRVEGKYAASAEGYQVAAADKVRSILGGEPPTPWDQAMPKRPTFFRRFVVPVFGTVPSALVLAWVTAIVAHFALGWGNVESVIAAGAALAFCVWLLVLKIRARH